MQGEIGGGVLARELGIIAPSCFAAVYATLAAFVPVLLSNRAVFEARAAAEI